MPNILLAFDSRNYIEDCEKDRAEKKLLLKLKEAEDAVKTGEEWLSLEELKGAVEKFDKREEGVRHAF